MPKSKFRILASVSILMMLFSYAIHVSYAATHLMQTKICTEKDVYLTREPIIVNYEVKNVANKTIRLNFLAMGMYFNIKDQDGKGYENKLNVSIGFAYPDSLNPGESYEGSENITDRYAVINSGEYTCFLDSPSPEAKSNILTIKVKSPTGYEKKALDMFLEAEKLKWARNDDSMKDLKKAELGFLKYQELVDRYPNSIYAALSLDRAMGVYKYSITLEERRKIIPVCKRLIENYPNSLYFSSAFMSLVDVYEVLKDKHGAIRTMNELIKKHPNTKISEWAEHWLKKIEEWKFE
jgi:tetratricopeptide (TPR) repeat protein